MNNWETVRSDIGIREGLTFHSGVAYGFNSAGDEVRQARGGAVIATTPAPPTDSALPTGTDPSAAASPPSDAANPSN